MTKCRLYSVLILVFCAFTMLGSFGAFAQTQAPEDTPPVAASAAAQDQASSQPQTAPERTEQPNASASDIQAEIDAAVQARRAADQAIIDGVLRQSELQAAEGPAAPEANSDMPAAKRPAFADPQVLKAKGQAALDKVIGWLKSPSFLAQIGAILLAYFLAPILAGQVRKRLFLFREPPAKGAKFALARSYVYQARNFLRAIWLIALLALFAVILKSVPALGQDWLVKIAQGFAVVFLLYKAIKQFLVSPLFQKLALWTLIPLAILMVFGFYDDLTQWLKTAELMKMGDTPITAMTLVRLGIFGSIFFYLGNFSNQKGQSAIRKQEGLDAGVREIVAKLFQIILFAVMFFLILSTAGIPLSGLVVVFSAIGLGVGFGLQPIAANFVSGLIILFDRTVKVGDFVVLPDGQEGFVEAINMRSTTVETTDGKDIMVPNTKFTEDAYENWTHKDPRQRYEVHFAVSYDTDIDTLEDILIPAVLEHPQVLREPEMPDLELRSFGDFGINFAIEFWCDGIDDGPNKFTSDLNFIVWRTLKANGIAMPLPQREVRMLESKPKKAAK